MEGLTTLITLIFTIPIYVFFIILLIRFAKFLKVTPEYIQRIAVAQEKLVKLKAAYLSALNKNNSKQNTNAETQN